MLYLSQFIDLTTATPAEAAQHLIELVVFALSYRYERAKKERDPEELASWSERLRQYASAMSQLLLDKESLSPELGERLQHCIQQINETTTSDAQLIKDMREEKQITPELLEKIKKITTEIRVGEAALFQEFGFAFDDDNQKIDQTQSYELSYTPPEVFYAGFPELRNTAGKRLINREQMDKGIYILRYQEQRLIIMSDLGKDRSGRRNSAGVELVFPSQALTDEFLAILQKARPAQLSPILSHVVKSVFGHKDAVNGNKYDWFYVEPATKIEVRSV